MSRTLLEEVQSLLAEYESAQEDLGVLYVRKREALVAARPHEIAAVVRTEDELAQRLRRIVTRRGRILQRAGSDGRPADSLASVAGDLEGDRAAELRTRIERVRHRAEELRHESWQQWIIAQRAASHYGDLIELIAGHGRSSPTYESSAEPRPAPGGAILDASA